MPPVLDVAFDELMRCRAEEVLAGELALRDDQRDHVLELIAESVRATGLVERGSRPQAAGQRLIDEPAVQHDVQRAIRGLHLDGRLDVVPRPLDLAQEGAVIGATPTPHEVERRLAALGLAEHDHDLSAFPRRQLEARLQRGTRIHARPERLL